MIFQDPKAMRFFIVLGITVMTLVVVPGTVALFSMFNPIARLKTHARSGVKKNQTPNLFPNYLELRAQAGLPLRFWTYARFAALMLTAIYIALLVTDPGVGLFLWWRLTVPMLPLLFLVAPGVWRNICPLAASNQTPRMLNFSRAWNPPTWLREYGFVIGVGGFFLCASARKWLFNADGPATGALIFAAMAFAMLGGFFFKGKSGWCSSICPLYPVQRLYNRTPLVTVPNAYCTPCVGCTKNCYDFTPGSAYLHDMTDDDRHYRNYRKFFAAAMPGFILAYFVVPDPQDFTTVVGMYIQFALYMVLSVGVFNVVDSLLKLSLNKITALFGAAAFNLFYWFGLPPYVAAVSKVIGIALPTSLAPVLQIIIVAMTIVWVARTFRRERVFFKQRQPSNLIPLIAAPTVAARPARHPATSGVTFLPNETSVVAQAGQTLLELAEKNNQPIEAGCRMGVCGADPVVITEGMENLSPMSSDEKNTLERLGLGANCRLACMCRVNGPCQVSTDVKNAPAAAPAPVMVTNYDRTVKSVVILGNGIAGVTAADYVRRNHPDCEIHLVSREKHHFYNRMAITRLIYGRSAMTGLYLQPEAWYDQHKITCWLNTHAVQINRGHRRVLLATGETINYDRLILACGSSSFVPNIPGFGKPGSFVLREAEDAMEIRSYIQQHQSSHAVVAGGGLLGLEAAYGLHKMGLTVSVLERGDWLLRRQLDERGARALKQHLESIGLTILTGAEIDSVDGGGRIAQAKLKDGRELVCDVFMVAVGIKPNLELARAAGVDVRQGILVDEKMRTSAHGIYAAGDVCEFSKQIPGLWAVAVEQAQVAAINAVGGKASYKPIVPVTMLKVVGVDLTSIGRINAESHKEQEIVLEDIEANRYGKLVVHAGKLVGAILLGYPEYAPAVTMLIKEGIEIRDYLDALRDGHWGVLLVALAEKQKASVAPTVSRSKKEIHTTPAPQLPHPHFPAFARSGD